MARDSQYTKEYRCTKCKKQVQNRKDLTVKKVSFHEMGARAKTFKSRVIGWLCKPCLQADIDWMREAYVDPTEADPTVAPATGPVGPGQLSIPA